MHIYRLLVGLLVLNVSANAFDYTTLPMPIITKGRQRCLHSRVIFLEDGDGNQYVLKEYPNTIRKPLLTSTVCEILATDMAHAVGVSHDRACLVPAGIELEGKTKHLPASLHTHVSGIAYKECKNSYYKGLCLLQEKNKGLTRDIIYHMSRHRDLPALVALDTFVGNNDRGRTNYFYEKEYDRFMGIDLGCAFTRRLCAPSIKNIELLISDPLMHLSENEWQALSAYTATLQELITLYPPDVSCALLDQYAEQAGFYSDEYFDTNAQVKWQEYFLYNKKTIQANYESSLDLLNTLRAFLRTHYL